MQLLAADHQSKNFHPNTAGLQSECRKYTLHQYINRILKDTSNAMVNAENWFIP